MTENHTKTLVFTTLDILQLKELIIVKIFTVWIQTYLQTYIFTVVNHANWYIEEKNEKKYLIFHSTDENKELLKNTIMFGMELKTTSKQ